MERLFKIAMEFRLRNGVVGGGEVKKVRNVGLLPDRRGRPTHLAY